MKKTKTLVGAGSGCLMLPFIGLAASASEPLVAIAAQLPNEVAYPIVGLAPQLLSESVPLTLQVSIDVESEFVVTKVVLEQEQAADDGMSFDQHEYHEQPGEDSADEVTLGTLMVSLQSEQSGAEVPTLVKGAEDGYRAKALKRWLLPFDDATKALGLKQTLQADGRLELKSSEMVTHISLESLQRDPQLGLVWSVGEIEAQLGAAAEFDRSEYAVRFNQSALHQSAADKRQLLQSDTNSPGLADSYGLARHYLAEANLTPELEPAPEPEVAVQAETSSRSELLQETTHLVSQETVENTLGVMLVGLAIDDMTTIEATLVKGREDGVNAIALDSWLIPFDDAIAALGGSVTVQTDGLAAIRAPGLATSLDLSQLQVDDDLGQVISVADIKEKFGIATEFSFSTYAINFLPPKGFQSNATSARGRSNRQDRYHSQPVITTGLPFVAPSAMSLSGLRQETRLNSQGTDGTLNQPAGKLSAVGSVLGGSWYAQLNQPKIGSLSTWQIEDLQYFRQSSAPASADEAVSQNADYVLGSQSTFWRSLNQQRRSQRNQSYWGATTVRRWGFSAPAYASQGGFNASSRMRSNQIGRTVSGEADPGTFVQLTQGLNGPVLDETIVDSSGVYRFEDVPVGSSAQYASRRYQVQLYANGQLTNSPEIRTATFTTLPGQLPKGASTMVASLGMGYQLKPNQILGNFNTLRGGIAYRRGVSEALTVGAGFVQDGAPQILTEAFYLPEGVPLQAAFSTLVDMTSGETRVDADVRYQPADNLRMTFDSDQLSRRFDIDWKLLPQVTLTAAGNSRTRTLSVGASANYRTGQWMGRANASIDTRQNLRWQLSATNQRFNFSHQGNEVYTATEAAYLLPNRRPGVALNRLGHQLVLSYETRKQLSTGIDFDGRQLTFPTGRLAIAQWRYRSPVRAADGQSTWNYSLGYGLGSQGSGPVASVSAAIGAGVDLQMRYQGISAFSDKDSFQLSLVSNLDTRNGLGWGDRNQNRLRSQGGLLLQPFLDINSNGSREAEEPLYLEDPHLLLKVDKDSLQYRQAKIQPDGVLLTMPPATYRVDIDPAGLPIDRTARELAYAVDVIAGQYTTVSVPLTLSYTVSGVVIDSNGESVSGARVEAISASGHRKMSVTNGAGVYYLERLYPEIYDIQVDGTVLENAPLMLEEETSPFLEREIHLL